MKKTQKTPLWIVRKREAKNAKRQGHKPPVFKAGNTKVSR
jgi:hypothetical protein